MSLSLRANIPADRRTRWARRLALVFLAAAVAAVVVAARSGGDTPDARWADEFGGDAGAAPARHWSPQTGGGGWGNGEQQVYTRRPENVSLDGDGHLRITARREADGSITSARLQSTEAFTGGILEARIKVPAGRGLWSAFWTLGQGHERIGWPQSGEIDVLEAFNDARTLHANAHVADPRAGDGQWQQQGSIRPAEPLSAGWHVPGVRWTRDALVFTLDGKAYHRVLRSAAERDGRTWPFDRPQVLLLNLAVGGSWPGPPDASTPFPATMLVDWVRVRDLDTP